MGQKIIVSFISFAVLMLVVTGCGQTQNNQAQPVEIKVSATIAQLESEVEAVYEKVEPAVVNITTHSVAYTVFNQPVPESGAGSGFLFDADGHIVTNYHVVENADSVTVNFGNGRVEKATIVGTDPSNDLAVILVGKNNLPNPVEIADSDKLKVGQFVVALGNPFGLNGTLTFGVISALGRTIISPDNRFIGEAIQTDTPINPGNSGGPLLNLKGQVVGINSQIVSPSGSSAGIGFAVSSNTLRRVVPALIKNGKYPHPWFGITSIDISPDLKDVFKSAGYSIPVDHGLLVFEVGKNSPAEKMGVVGGTKTVQIQNWNVILGGDIIVAINDLPIANFSDFNVYLESKTKVGDTIEVSYYRGNAMLKGKALLTERLAK